MSKSRVLVLSSEPSCDTTHFSSNSFADLARVSTLTGVADPYGQNKVGNKEATA